MTTTEPVTPEVILAAKFNKKLGKNAIVRTKVKNIRPKDAVKNHPKYLNTYKDAAEDLIVVNLIRRKIDRTKDVLCLIVSFKDATLFPTENGFYVRASTPALVTTGPPNQVFKLMARAEARAIAPPGPTPTGPTPTGEAPAPPATNLPPQPDENESDNEGSVTSGNPPDPVNPADVVWGPFVNDVRINARQGNQFKAKLTGYSIRNAFGYSLRGMVKEFLPMEFIRDVVLPETTKLLATTNLKALPEDELFLWLGMTIVMSLNPAYKMRDFFSMRSRDEIFACPYLGHHMTRDRYQEIKQNFAITKRSPPTYRDKFWEVREM